MNQNQRPLLLTGMFRSGTTLFAYMLNANKNINLISDTFAPFFKVFRNFYAKKYFKKFDPESPLNDYYFDKKQNELYKILQKKNFNTKISKNDLSYLKKKLIQQNTAYYPKLIKYLKSLEGKTFKIILKNFLNIIEKISYKKKNIVGFKEVWIGEFTKHFLEATKNSKVICIIRDPRAVIASKLFAKEQYPLIFLIRQWRKLASLYLLFKNKKKNILIIKYEDLIRHPINTSKKVCKFLNTKYDSSMVNFSNLKDNEGNQWIQNSTFKKKKSFNQTSINNWKYKLDKNIIKVVEFFCWNEMNLFGYNLNYKVNNIMDFNNLKSLKKKGNLAKWIKPYSKYNFKKEYLNEKKRNEILLSKIKINNNLNSLLFLKIN